MASQEGEFEQLVSVPAGAILPEVNAPARMVPAPSEIPPPERREEKQAAARGKRRKKEHA